VPRGESWHVSLLNDAGVDAPTRPWVLTAGLRDRLEDYLKLRHAVRNVYPQRLEWPRLAALLSDMDDVLGRLEREVRDFLVRLEDWPSPQLESE
jgi:hypothetical protein